MQISYSNMRSETRVQRADPRYHLAGSQMHVQQVSSTLAVAALSVFVLPRNLPATLLLMAAEYL